MTYTKRRELGGVGDSCSRMRRDPGGTLDALSIRPSLQDYQVSALILVSDFIGRYSHHFNLPEPQFLFLDICTTGPPWRSSSTLMFVAPRYPLGVPPGLGGGPEAREAPCHAGWCRVAGLVPKCGFVGLCQAGGSSALYNKPADTSQSREFSPRSTDAFTPTQAPA